VGVYIYMSAAAWASHGPLEPGAMYTMHEAVASHPEAGEGNGMRGLHEAKPTACNRPM